MYEKTLFFKFYTSLKFLTLLLQVDKNRNAKTSIPNLPEGKCLAEIIVDIDVDKVFK